jgi:phospholipid/cholesterol/gamma-HCH transport system substrate-binding protein
MAAKNHVEFKVGVIVLLGLIVLAASMYWLQGYKLESNSRLIRVHFADVGSLAVGDRVTVSGVYKGKVKAFDLTADGVVVEILISRDVVLRRDATFAIKNMGVMGERFIAILPGTDSLPLDTIIISTGASDTGIPEIMGLLGETITELRYLITSLKESVSTDSPLEKLNQTLANLNRMSSSLAGYLERNESRLDGAARDFAHASKQLDQLLTNNSASIDSSISRVDRVSEGMERFVSQLDTIAVAVRSFTDALETQEGSLKLLVEDRRLYDDLRRTVDNFDDLIQDIKADPRKYINLKVELF